MKLKDDKRRLIIKGKEDFLKKYKGEQLNSLQGYEISATMTD